MRMSRLKLAVLTLLLWAQSPSAQADSIQYLAHNDQALAARLALIENAKRTIDLTTFIFETCDSSTKLLIEALVRKARPQDGSNRVRVRVHLDNFMLKETVRAQLAEYLGRHGIDFKVYNDSFLVGDNVRSHVKLLVVDGSSYIIGGRNLSDEYFSLSAKNNYIDREVLVRGDSARDAQAYFEELWNTRMNKRPRARADLPRLEQVCLARNARDQAVASHLRKNARSLQAKTPVRSCSVVRFAGDNPEFASARYSEMRTGDDNRPEDFMNPLRLREKRSSVLQLAFMEGSRRTLEMENWSYIPAHQIWQTLKNLRKARVRVEILTNAAAGAGGVLDSSFDQIMGHYARRHTEGTQAVVQVCRSGHLRDAHALTPAGSTWKIHSKVAVRDDRDSLVGSYNIDPRSFHTNLEASIVAENCPELARDLQAGFKTLRQTFMRDRGLPQCQKNLEVNLLSKLLGWVSHELL